MNHQPLVAGIELGGTKCVCILASGPDDIRDVVRIETTDPDTTLGRIAATMAGWKTTTGFDAIGIGAFGPIALDPAAVDYGRVTRTPKPGWNGAPIVDRLAGPHAVPFGFETDVNGAALAEGRWGAARGLAHHAYVTVGTGVGVGCIVGGVPLLGASHMELGHLRIPRTPGDTWPGICPFHGDCVEGLVSGPAIKARRGIAGSELAADDPYWQQFSDELAAMLHALVIATWPRRIAIGGGVMATRADLFPGLAVRLRASLGGYGLAGEPGFLHDDYVGPPALGGDAGPLGAIAIGLAALAGGSRQSPRHRAAVSR